MTAMIQKTQKMVKLGTWFYAALWAASILIAVEFLPIQEWSTHIRDFALEQGAFGAVVFAGVFILATICLIPCAFLTFSAGVAYGIWGVPLVMFSAVIGASLSFFIARYLLRERVRRWLSYRTNTEALAETIEEGGWKMMLLLRLSPMIPFNVNNYFLGTVNVRFLEYIVVMIGGTLPLTSLLVYLGSLGRSLNHVHPLQAALLATGAVATAIFAQRVLKTRTRLLRDN
jgi:uncharacterized membrane protein YdjX (TVP38/TMEM64 family)